MNGVTHIAETFAAAKAQGRAAFMPYFTLGYPGLETSVEVIAAIAGAGADLIELGIPFSDPLADGPTIQHSTQVALESGASVARCLEMVSALRSRGVAQPLLLMGYYNPILTYGVEAFAARAAKAGVVGFIIPDLPPEEAAPLLAACQAHDLALVFLAAPTSSPERLRYIASRSTGFLYLVSLTGVTGVRSALPAGLSEFIGRVRSATDLPLAVGFGISTPEQARMVAGQADGVITGSALIDAVRRSPQDPCGAAADLVARLRAAV